MLETKWASDVEIEDSHWRVGTSLAGYRVSQASEVRLDESGKARIAKLNPEPY